MKKLMTIVLAIVLIAGFTSTTKAQISIGAKAGIALPMGAFGDANGLGFGGSAIGEYAINEKMAVGLNIGYYSFGGKTITLDGSSSSSNSYDTPTFRIIPILADFKYFFTTEGFKPYIGAGLGLYMGSTPDVTESGITYPGFSQTSFGFAPKVGFWMGDGLKYGASLEYNILSYSSDIKVNGVLVSTSRSFAHLGINVGIIYPLGK